MELRDATNDDLMEELKARHVAVVVLLMRDLLPTTDEEMEEGSTSETTYHYTGNLHTCIGMTWDFLQDLYHQRKLRRWEDKEA